MAKFLENVDKRTQLAGHNRMELLLFRLHGKQRYGINVFKVREVIHCPPLTKIPHSKSIVKGVVNIRGKTIAVVDLASAIGLKPSEHSLQYFVIVTEFNRHVQGFLVTSVERIVNLEWDAVRPPPQAAGANNFLTAVTEIDDELVEIVDVEKVLNEVIDLPTTITDHMLDSVDTTANQHWQVLLVDDSAVARKQIERTLAQLGVQFVSAKNGREGLELLQLWANSEPAKLDRLLMVISDIEMPEMDGYMLTAEIRQNPVLRKLYVLLHTSLSGIFNTALAQQVGADCFVPKFSADELGKAVVERISEIVGARAAPAGAAREKEEVNV